MKYCINRSYGFVLLPVVLAILLVATVAFLISQQSAMQLNQSASEADFNKIKYIAQAGMQHAIWTANNSSCTGYAIASTNFNNDSYGAVFSPNSGSPITIVSTGTLANGVNHELTRNNIIITDERTLTTTVIQPSAAIGKDTFIEGESSHVTHNKASDADLKTDSETNKSFRTLLQFDLENIPVAAKIQTATLELYLDSNTGTEDTVNAHTLLQSWTEDGVNWNTYDGINAWTNTGGDYAITSAGSFIASGTGWKSMELLNTVQSWVDTSLTNNGIILLSDDGLGNNEKVYTSSDDADSTKHPKLTITYACECGVDCSLDEAVSYVCPDYTPNTKLSEFSTSGLSIDDAWGISFIPEGTTFNNNTAPVNGAWLLVDGSNKDFYFVDTSGSELTNKKIPLTEPKDVALIKTGTWINHLAVTDSTDNKIYFLDLKAKSKGVISTASFSQHPIGIDFIQNSESATYNSHLVISSDEDESGNNVGNLTIIDQMGVVKTSININSFAAEPWGVTHIHGTDKLLVAEKNGNIYTVGFDGTLYGQYNATSLDAKAPQAIAINPLNCNHVIVDKASEKTIDLNLVSTVKKPVAHWKLDETTGTTAVDSENGHDGILTDGPVWEAAGEIDGALDFDGVNDRIIVNHDSSLALTSALTMTAWVKNQDSSLSSTYRIISKEQSGQNDAYWMAISGTTIYMGIGGNFFAASTTMTTNQWYHLAGTYDDTADEVRIYLDGVLLSTQSTAAVLNANTANIQIGNNWQNSKPWNGLLDDVRLYDFALTTTEVGELISSGEVSGAVSSSSNCDGYYLDQFNTRSFSGDDGTLAWSGNWEEVGESDGATSGDIIVDTDLSNYQIRIRDNENAGEGVQREADLSGAASATLSFDYSRVYLDSSSDYVAVMASNSGTGGPWTEIGRIQGGGTDNSYLPYSVSLTDYISANSAIRLIGSPSLGSNDSIWFDNIKIECSP